LSPKSTLEIAASYVPDAPLSFLNFH
jgi:hypothetical protein